MRTPERWNRPWTPFEWQIARIMDSGEAVGAAELAQIVGCTAGAVKIIRRRLVDEGYFRIVARGGGRGRKPVYAPTPSSQ
jgi:hypothetical protein